MEDADELLRRCQRGDESALTEIVHRFEERIFRLAFRVTGDAALAEEAAVEALAKIWSKAGQWRGESRAGTWIYQVALRTILDHRRAWRRSWRKWWSPTHDLPDPRPGPLEGLVELEKQDRQARRLEVGLAQLSEADRALVHLYYFEQLALADIAAILGVNRDAVKMRLARARQRLRERFQDDDELL